MTPERARLRAGARRATRAFFEARGFLEVETPCLVEGGSLDPHVRLFEVPVAGGRTAFLRSSPEHALKRLTARGLGPLFELARVFRHGEAGARHNPEFTLLEWYRPAASWRAMVDDTEALVHGLAVALVGAPVVTGPDGRRCDVTPPWPRLSVREAFERHAGFDPLSPALRDDAGALLAAARGAAIAFPDGARPWPWDEVFTWVLGERVEPALVASDRPLVLHDYPARVCTYARRVPGDPAAAERFEAFVAGVELCNGFGELADPVEQRARFDAEHARREASGEPRGAPVDERFLAELPGLAGAAGNAVGFDRLVMLLAGARDLGEVVFFPAASDPA